MIIFLPPKDFKLPKMAFEYSIASPVKWAFDISFIPRGVAYPVPFITSSRDGSNFPGEKCRLCFSPFHSGTVFSRVPLLEFHLSDGKKK